MLEENLLSKQTLLSRSEKESLKQKVNINKLITELDALKNRNSQLSKDVILIIYLVYKLTSSLSQTVFCNQFILFFQTFF